MPPKGTKAKSTPKLSAHNFLPTISKPDEIVGDFIAMPGREWSGCPAGDKDKLFRCVVRKFEAVHDFGALKGAGFEVQEMGESGEGSLEPGVASGTATTQLLHTPVWSGTASTHTVLMIIMSIMSCV